MLSEQEIIDAFNNIGITLYSGGVMGYDPVTQKKKNIDFNRPDNMPKKPTDNFFRFRAENTPYLIVDADGIDIQTLESKYPSLKHTFYTTTTKPDRRHYYLLPPEGKKWPLTSTIGVEGENTYDLLVYYLIFEGHAYDINPNYSIVQNEPQRATEEEYHNLVKLLNRGKSDITRNIKVVPRVPNPAKTNLVHRYLKDEHTEDDIKKLVTWLYPNNGAKGSHNKTFRNFFFNSAGKPSHEKFNYMAWKLTYTELSYKTRDEFIAKVLRDNGIDPDSKESKKHLDRSIYATLPKFGEWSINHGTTAKELIDDMKQTSPDPTGNWGVIKYQSKKEYNFMEIHLKTLKPRVLSNEDNGGFGWGKLESMFVGSGAKKAEIIYALPETILVSNPFKPTVFYDEENLMRVYNIAPKSNYYLSAVPSPEKPDGLFNKAIDSYFGEYRDFYDHWLAHHMYSTRPPATTLIAVAGHLVTGGSGKSFVTSSLPAKLIPTANRVREDVIKSNFSAPLGTSLQIYNDITSKKIFRDYIYQEIKDGSTGGAPTFKNLKYGGIVKVIHATGYALSANFFPSLDSDHDRRMWVVVPQHTEGATEPLTIEERQELDMYIEGYKSEEYVEELQVYANYLKYLYEEERDKYYNELYIEAPKTKYFEKCIEVKQSQMVYHLLTTNPKSIISYIKPEREAEIYRMFSYFLYLYNKTSNNVLSIPSNAIARLLELMGSVDDYNGLTPKNIEKMIGVDFRERPGASYTKWHGQEDEFRALGLPTEWAHFAITNQLRLELTPDLLEDYKWMASQYKQEADGLIEID